MPGHPGAGRREEGHMPIYMDRHYIEGATAHAVAIAHNADLAGQDEYRVRFMTYWFDEVRSTAFCLVDSPDGETIRHAHHELHGLVPHEIIEVERGVRVFSILWARRASSG
jgi:hypothetical protein